MDLKMITMKLVFWVAISQCFCFCIGFKFSVGGRDGWILHPSEDYSHWAGRNRFLVNDTLYFKYKKGEDSVLEVTKDDYYTCNTSNLLMKSENGSSEFILARSGPFFFISGVKDHCEKGQKLLIIVLSEKHRRAVSPAAAPTPARHRAPATAPSHPSIATSPTTTQSPSSEPESSPPGESPTQAVPPASSPLPSVQSPSTPVVATPPGSPDEGAPPTPTPVSSPKAAASAMASALPVSIALIFSSSLFFGLV